MTEKEEPDYPVDEPRAIRYARKIIKCADEPGLVDDSILNLAFVALGAIHDRDVSDRLVAKIERLIRREGP